MGEGKVNGQGKGGILEGGEERVWNISGKAINRQQAQREVLL